MPSSPARYFLCTGQCVTAERFDKYPNSHIIGELRYIVDEGEQVTAFALYDKPLTTTGIVLPGIQRIRTWHIGDARGIECWICGKAQRWEIGNSAYRALRNRREKVTV